MASNIKAGQRVGYDRDERLRPNIPHDVQTIGRELGLSQLIPSSMVTQSADAQRNRPGLDRDQQLRLRRCIQEP